MHFRERRWAKYQFASRANTNRAKRGSSNRTSSSFHFSIVGVILSGNEISQILSLILTYYGGYGHRPKWIAVGVGCSALSCLVLAMPHFMYGPGKNALALTEEYFLDHNYFVNETSSSSKDLAICPRTDVPAHCDASTKSGILLPRLLIFLSQFILGIGTTLYYSLGQTYLDDNTKKKNTPMLLGEHLRR